MAATAPLTRLDSYTPRVPLEFSETQIAQIASSALNHHILISKSGEPLLPEEQTIIDLVNKAIKTMKLTNEPQYIRHNTSHLARTLFVEPEGVFMLLTRKKLKDLCSTGSAKKTYTAIDLATDKPVTYFSVNNSPRYIYGKGLVDRTEKNEAEFLIQSQLGSDITAPTFPRSAVIQPAKARFCYLGEKMDGDLFDGAKLGAPTEKGKIDLDDLGTRFDVCYQMAEVTARFHEKTKAQNEIESVHRDLKPENYLYTYKDGKLEIRLADFEFTVQSGQDVTLCGDGLYVDPHAVRDSRAELLGSPFGTYRASSLNDCWGLGMSLLRMLYHRNLLDKNWLLKNPKLASVLLNVNNISFMNALAEIKTQERWLKIPPAADSIEFVIYMLLKIDPKERYTTRQAADELLRLKNALPTA